MIIYKDDLMWLCDGVILMSTDHWFNGRQIMTVSPGVCLRDTKCGF